MENTENRNMLKSSILRFISKRKKVECLEEDAAFSLPDGKHVLLESIAVDGLVAHIGAIVIHRGG